MRDDIRVRNFPESNYRAVFFNGKTLRFAMNKSKPITELKYPEFYDVKITNFCLSECPWCYQDSNPKEDHPKDILSKFNSFFSNMSENEKPFQIAFGGGEPTAHPNFCDLLMLCDTLDIVPNYTTNGMFVDNINASQILKYTKSLCGGVALSTHPHLISYWYEALGCFSELGIKVNFHVIISDVDSIEYFLKLYNDYSDKIEYFVLLPYGAQGRAKDKKVEFSALFESIKKLPDTSKISYGANFYEELKKHSWLDVSLYEPEIFSKYLDLGNMKLYRSSFNLEEVIRK